jgi:transposase
MKILAIDMGNRKSVGCVYESGTGEHRFQTIRTRPEEVRDLVIAEAPGRVVIEIGPLAGWMSDVCRELGVELEVADTSQEAWRWKKVKRKTDRDDALKLARLSAMNQIHAVHVPEARVRGWRETIRYRHALVGRRTAIKNSIRGILNRRAIEWPAGAAGWSKKMRRLLRSLASVEDGLTWRTMLLEELDQLEQVEGSIERIEDVLDQIAAMNPGVALLQTIDGVGPRLAEIVVALIDDPRRFRNRKQVGCYAGLTPRKIQSGAMDRTGRISRQGDDLLRSLLVEVAWISRQYNPWLKEVHERVMRGSSSRKKIAIVAVARRLLIVCWAMLRDGTQWRQAKGARLHLVA